MLSTAVRDWLLDPKRGAARLMGVATAAAGFLVVAYVAQGAMASGFRHTGLVLAVYAGVLLAAGAGAALAAPALVRVWGWLLKIIGEPTPLAALLVISVAGGMAAAWSVAADGPGAVGAIGVGLLTLLLSLGAVETLSRRRR